MPWMIDRFNAQKQDDVQWPTKSAAFAQWEHGCRLDVNGYVWNGEEQLARIYEVANLHTIKLKTYNPRGMDQTIQIYRGLDEEHAKAIFDNLSASLLKVCESDVGEYKNDGESLVEIENAECFRQTAEWTSEIY